VAGPLLEGDGRPETGGVPVDQLLQLGLGADNDGSQFDMTAFSLRLTRGANAVSQLHSHTANGTWAPLLGDRPILGITNGIHPPTWTGTSMRELLERYLDADLDDLDNEVPERRFWERIDRIPAAELWEAHQRQKRELANFARKRLRAQFARHGEAPSVLEQLERALDPAIMTIGFARRFATYKRAGMIFSDLDRLARLLQDEARPVQIVFAGKAHPADRPGQSVIQDIFARTRSEKLGGRAFVLEDYDMRIARFLVQGVDVWLNNPRRPLEASGTSGMKAAGNGVVNVSVLDGWWDEGWTGDNGWAIGGRETNPDEGAQDWADAQDLYRLLETEIVPAYYDRGADGIPTRWIDLMRRSMATTLWRFSTTRMLQQYAEQLYLPACRPSTSPCPQRPRRADRRQSRRTRRTAITAEKERRPWRRRSRSPSRSTTTSRSATSAGCSRRSSSRPTGRWSTRSNGIPAFGSRSTTPGRCSSGCRPSAPSSSRDSSHSSSAARSSSSAAGSTSRSSRPCPLAIGSPSSSGWPTSSSH
jgi:alpha-glucan phosphorylase-like protein